MSPTSAVPPAAPRGVPAWLIRSAAFLTAVCGLAVAFVDPSASRFTPAIKAAIIVVFLVVAAVIFVTHLVLAAVHEYGWNLNAAQHIEAGVEAEVAQIWPQIKEQYSAALPALDQAKGFATVLSAIGTDVASLKAKAADVGVTPESIVAALEQATGMTFPRVAPPADIPAPAEDAPASDGADPTVTVPAGMPV